MGIILGSFNDISVYWYGLIMSIAILLGIAITIKNNSGRINFETLLDLCIVALLTSLVTGRLVFVLNNFVLYKKDLWDILYLWQGGFSIYGAMLGVLISTYCYCKMKKIKYLELADILTPGLMFILIGNQLANFATQEVIGNPSDNRLSVYIEYAFRPPGFEQYDFFQPISLYQVLWLMFVLGLIFYISKNNKYLFEGAIFFISLLLAALGRFILGFYYLGGNNGLRIEQVFLFGIMLFLIVAFSHRLLFSKKK